MANDNGDLLAALQRHGHEFMRQFPQDELPPPKKRRVDNFEVADEQNSTNASDEEEWSGISDVQDRLDSQRRRHGPEMQHEYDSDNTPDDAPRVDVANSSNSRAPEVIVFSGTRAVRTKQAGRPTRNGFMSSRVSKLTQDFPVSIATQDAEGDDVEKSNTRNDILLHQLVQTRLLSGSLDHQDFSKPAQKRKALEGRAMELASTVRLGKGETAVLKAEHKRATKRIREGIAAKAVERNTKRLEEAKNAGNYHSTIKRLFDAPDVVRPKTRERGLKLGVGKFVSGTLRLSRNEVSRVTGSNGGERSTRKNGSTKRKAR